MTLLKMLCGFWKEIVDFERFPWQRGQTILTSCQGGNYSRLLIENTSKIGGKMKHVDILLVWTHTSKTVFPFTGFWMDFFRERVRSQNVKNVTFFHHSNLNRQRFLTDRYRSYSLYAKLKNCRLLYSYLFMCVFWHPLPLMNINGVQQRIC